MKSLFLGILLTLCLTFASFGVGLEGVNLQSAYVAPNDVDETFNYGAGLNFGDLGSVFGLLGGMDFGATFTYFLSEEELATVNETVNTSLSDFASRLFFNQYFSADSAFFNPYVTAGLGMHMYTASVDDGVNKVSKDETQIGTVLGAGILLQVSPKLGATFEVLADFTELDQIGVGTKFSYTFGPKS
jgi:opacity protein-like surface antigen